MSLPFQDPEDHAERVEAVLKRASALSEELRNTLTELTQILRSEGEASVSAGESTNPDH